MVSSHIPRGCTWPAMCINRNEYFEPRALTQAQHQTSTGLAGRQEWVLIEEPPHGTTAGQAGRATSAGGEIALRTLLTGDARGFTAAARKAGLRLAAGEAQVLVQPVVGLEDALALREGQAFGPALGRIENAARRRRGDLARGPPVPPPRSPSSAGPSAPRGGPARRSAGLYVFSAAAFLPSPRRGRGGGGEGARAAGPLTRPSATLSRKGRGNNAKHVLRLAGTKAGSRPPNPESRPSAAVCRFGSSPAPRPARLWRARRPSFPRLVFVRQIRVPHSALRTPRFALRTLNSCSRLGLQKRVSPGFRFPVPRPLFPVPRSLFPPFPPSTGVPRFPVPRSRFPVPRFWELSTTAYAHPSMSKTIKFGSKSVKKATFSVKKASKRRAFRHAHLNIWGSHPLWR